MHKPSSSILPLIRISTCGHLNVEVLHEDEPLPDGHVTFAYKPPIITNNGGGTALNLLKLLVSQPGRFATKDWLTETLRRNKSGDEEELVALVRLDNIISLLRTVLSSGDKQLGKVLVEYVPPTPDSGSGYRLAPYPLIWLDVEAISTHVQRACQMQIEGNNPWAEWNAVYQLANAGPFLAEGWYSDWALTRREEVEGYLWQSVQGLWRQAVKLPEKTGEEEALRLLREYWLRHPENEDAFRPLVELLGTRGDYQRAEEYYAKLCRLLEEEGREPDGRTQKIMNFLRSGQDTSVLDLENLTLAQRAQKVFSRPRVKSRRIIKGSDNVSRESLPPQKMSEAEPISQKLSYLTQSLLDLDLLDSYADALHVLLMKGETLSVMHASQRWYQRLKQLFSFSKERRSAQILFRFGMLVGAAQECILPWYQRSYEVVQTYNDIEKNVIFKYDLESQLNQEYVQLLAKRGRQYRVRWKFEESEKACEEGIYRLRDLNDVSLQTHFLCERSHIEATKGDEMLWMYKLDAARKHALTMASEDREKALNQINYMQGEGYKRFAFHTQKDLTLSAREKFARRAIEQFYEWSGTTIELPGFESLVVQVSKVQCLILLSPDEAIHEAVRLEKLAGQFYPTLLDKLHRVNFLAQLRLQISDDEFLQVFTKNPLVVYGEGGNIL